MGNNEQLKIIRQNVKAWNKYMSENDQIVDLRGVDLARQNLAGVNLSGADLGRANLREADLSGSDLVGADLSEADLTGANLKNSEASGANLSNADLETAILSEGNFANAKLVAAILRGAFIGRANLSDADLSGTDLSGAKLQGADLKNAILTSAKLRSASLGWSTCRGAWLVNACLDYADLRYVDFSDSNLSAATLIGADLNGATMNDTDLTGANLSDANLSGTILVRTNFESANLADCRVYGVSAWDLRLTGTIQTNLAITPEGQPLIQVDRIDVAQFVYLLLNNAGIRNVIDTITSKVVLILGRFTDERKMILDALRSELRKRDYVPVMFDWEKPSSRDVTETVSTLAHMAKFVIADITDARSIPQELMAIVPCLPSVPVQPLLLTSDSEYGMFEHFRRYPWVLPLTRYSSQEDLLASLSEKVIDPLEAKLNEGRSNFA